MLFFLIISHHTPISLGCEKILLALAPLLGCDLLNYCKLPHWPLLNNRFLVLKNFLVNQKKKNNRKSDSNRKVIGVQLEKESLIQVNNFSFAHAIHLEMINNKIIRPVGRQHRDSIY